MRGPLHIHTVLSRTSIWSRQFSCWHFQSVVSNAEAVAPAKGTEAGLKVPLGPSGVVLQQYPSAGPTRQPWGVPAQSRSNIWQAFSKAPDDNPIDQPKTTYDRQDVPATKPGMDAPESPDATNPEIDRSDYSAPGTNPDVDHNDPDDYKPTSEDADDLKERGRSGKSKLPGSKGQHASANSLFASRLGLSMSSILPNTMAQPSGSVRHLHVFASANDDEGNVGKSSAAGAVHPHLPNRDEDDVTDKSEADTPTYDPNPELMTDEKLANRPKKPEKHKDGEAVSQDNTAMNNTGSGPKKQPEDIAPEQAGS